MSEVYNNIPIKNGQPSTKGKTYSVSSNNKVNLGNSGTGEGSTGEAESSRTFSIGYSVWEDKVEYTNKIKLDLKSTDVQEGLVGARELNGYYSTLNTKLALEAVNSVVTKNPLGMSALLGARFMLGAVDAKNTYGYSSAAALSYAGVTTFFKPTIFTYKAYGIKNLTEKLKSTNSGKWFYDNVSDRIHHMADHNNPLTTTFLKGTSNQIVLNVWSTNVIGKAEKLSVAKTFKASKHAIYGDKGHIGDGHEGPPPDLKKGDTGATFATVTGKYGETKQVLLNVTYDGEGNVTVDTKGLQPGQKVVTINEPIFLKGSKYLNSPENYWQSKITSAATGEPFKTPVRYDGSVSAKLAGLVVGTGEFLFGNLSNIISDYNAVGNAENQLALGQDENYQKNSRMATVLQDLKSAGGDYKIDPNTGNITITVPPPKKEKTTTSNLLVKTENKMLVDNANQVQTNKSRDFYNTKTRLKQKAEIQQEIKAAQNVQTLNKYAQAGRQINMVQTSIDNQKASEFDMYGQKGKEGLGVGIRRGSNGLNYNVYTQQQNAVTSNALQNAFGNNVQRVNGMPTIGPARNR